MNDIQSPDVIDALLPTLRALAKDVPADSPQMRAQVLQLVKEALAEGRQAAEQHLMRGGDGIGCALGLSDMMDRLIRALYEFAIGDVYPQGRTSTQAVAVVAVGGYGRGMLAPGSDIDLLFLLPVKKMQAVTKVVEYILYMLWDAGLKVGHASRTVDECISQSLADMTIRTSILEARLILGDAKLFDQLVRRFDQEVMKGSGAEFAQAKLAERDERHAKEGESRYLVEPNVKNGKGGLRDLHTLFWIGKYVYRVSDAAELVGKGVFTLQEYTLFSKSEAFLWTVRCHMHFLTGKPEERLHFDIQREMAARMGYFDNERQLGVERFMKAYFLVAKDVGDLTRIFCAALEVEQAETAPGFVRLLMGFSRRRRKLAGTTDFIVDNDRINIADDKVFERDPVNMLRLFWFGDRHGLEYHPDALKLLTRSLDLVDAKLRRDPKANRLFLDILTSDRNPELNLRRMNEAGLLGRLIPDFGKIVAMMQFNMYHHYTVDEHLLRCVAILAEIEHGGSEKLHPLSHKLVQELGRHREALYVAVLLHDIAKGRPEDHSTEGAKIARRICPALGLSAADTELVAWLIENHLLMSMTAQTRDLNDRKTITDFADVVQSLDRLKLLLLLTVCDIRGVGPGVWNGWKGQLLRNLYYETELLLTGGFSDLSRAERSAAARAALEEALSDWPPEEAQRYARLHYDNYLLTVDLKDQLRHAAFIRAADAAGRKMATSVKVHDFEGVTEITVLAQDHPRLLSVITGACAASGANIVDAQIFTATDGRALDTILISREFDRDEDEQRRGERVGRLIEEALLGKTWLEEVIEKKVRPKRGARAFRIEPRVDIGNQLSNRFSVIEVEGLDRPGLLSELTGALSDLSLDIANAHITTFGEKVIDTFYVTDLVGAKLENEERRDAVRARLLAVLSGSQKTEKRLSTVE